MILGVNLFDNTLEEALGIEDEGLTKCSHANLTIQFLLAPGTEGLQHLGRRIAQQRERQVVFLFELDMRGLAVFAHAKDLITLREESMVVIADITCLGRATRSRVLRLEINDCLFADQVFFSNRLSGFVGSAKCRHFVSNL